MEAADAGDATPTHSEFGDTDDEKEQPEEDASDDDAMEEDAAADDGSADVVAEYEAAAATPGAPRAAHEELVVCLRAVRAASSSTRWRTAQKAAWARFAERHSLSADEWLAREQAAAAASKEEVPLDRRLDALEAKLDALLARTSSG